MTTKTDSEILATIIENEILTTVDTFVGKDLTIKTKYQIKEEVYSILDKYGLANQILFDVVRGHNDDFVVYFYGDKKIKQKDFH